MPITCDHIRYSLLSDEGQDLSSDALEHLESCPECREVEQTLHGLEPVLHQAVQDSAQSISTELPGWLDNKVRKSFNRGLRARKSIHDMPVVTGSHARLKGVDQRGRGLNSLPAREKGKTSGRSGPNIISLLRQPALAWAAAAVLILGFSLTALFVAGSGDPAGFIDYHVGDVRVTRVSGDVIPAGDLETTDVARGMGLETRDNAGAIIRLASDGERYVSMFIAPFSSVRVLNHEHVELKSGRAWFGVEPHGAGFTVSTTAGRVRVTGTVFGVSVEDQATRVDVTEGSVLVTQKEQKVEVNAGQAVQSMNKGGISAPADRLDGDSDPGWVTGLFAGENVVGKGSYMPSIAPR